MVTYTLTEQINKTKQKYMTTRTLSTHLYRIQFNSGSVWVMKCVAVKGECISGFLGATVFSELKGKSVECRTLSFWEGQAVPEFTSYNLQYVDVV